MRQAELYDRVARLKPYQRLRVTHAQMAQAASGDLESGWDRVRRSDVEAFVKKIKQNWNLRVYHDHESDTYDLEFVPEATHAMIVVRELFGPMEVA